MNLPKLPSFAKGSVNIPVVKKKIPKVAIAGLILALAVAFYLYQKKKKEESMSAGLEAPLQPDPNLTNVEFEVVPNEVQPDASTTIVGKFTDIKTGKLASVPNAMYYVWETDINTNAKELRGQGSIGTNVASFSKPIGTTSFRQGQYTITVTDAPLPADEAMLMSRGPIVTGGSGEVARTPEGSQTPESVTFAIS